MKKLVIPLVVLAVVMLATSIAKRTKRKQLAGCVGAATAVREANLIGRVKIVAMDRGNDVLELIKEGTISATVAQQNELVTTQLPGKARVPCLPYVNREDTPFEVDTDYFGRKRNDENPDAGPFEVPGEGRLCLKVWPVVQKQTGSRRPAVVDQTALVMR